MLPLIEYTYIPERDMLGGQLRFDLNSVSLAREDHRRAEPASQRMTAELRWRHALRHRRWPALDSR